MGAWRIRAKTALVKRDFDNAKIDPHCAYASTIAAAGDASTVSFNTTITTPPYHSRTCAKIRYSVSRTLLDMIDIIFGIFQATGEPIRPSFRLPLAAILHPATDLNCAVDLPACDHMAGG